MDSVTRNELEQVIGAIQNGEVSANELARRSKVTQRAISGWVTGEFQSPRWHNVLRVHAALLAYREERQGVQA